MGKHRRSTLVRAWVDNYSKELPAAFVDDWEEGLDGFAGFFLPRNSDLARALPVHRHKVSFTVQGASAVEWWLDSCRYSTGGTDVICISREAHARRILASDEYLIEMWLRAEKRYLDELAQELLKV